MRKTFFNWRCWVRCLVNEDFYDSFESVTKAFAEKQIVISATAEKMLKALDFSRSRGKFGVELVCITPTQLGFTQKPLVMDFYNEAMEVGLQPLPRRFVPEIRLRVSDDEESFSEPIVIGSMPFALFHDHYALFTMSSGGDVECLSHINGPMISWRFELNTPFIFAKKIKHLQ